MDHLVHAFLCILVTKGFAHADLAHADFSPTKKMHEPRTRCTRFCTAQKIGFEILYEAIDLGLAC